MGKAAFSVVVGEGGAHVVNLEEVPLCSDSDSTRSPSCSPLYRMGAFIRNRKACFVGLLVFILLVSSMVVFWPASPALEKGRRKGWDCPAQQNSTYEQAAGDFTSTYQAICPRYFEGIQRDLADWKDGITEGMLHDARHRGASMRVTIISGKLYLQMYRDCPQSRPMFTIWGLLMLLQKFPGQVPDVDFLINCKDRPIIHSDWQAPPVFSYCRNNQSHDILIPDYSYWGWPEVNIDPWGKQASDIFASSEKTEWKNRRPSAFWKGNIRMGKLRKHLIECNSPTVEIYDQDWSPAGFRNSKLTKQCKNRYNIYAEGAAWSASLKYRMACGSTLLYINSDYYDFFSRALLPGVHYMLISSDPSKLCPSLQQAVMLGNRLPEEAERIAKNGRSFMEKDLGMENVYDYWFHLLSAYAKLQRFKPRVPRSWNPFVSLPEMDTERLQCIASEKAKTFLNKPQFTSTRNPCVL